MSDVHEIAKGIRIDLIERISHKYYAPHYVSDLVPGGPDWVFYTSISGSILRVSFYEACVKIDRPDKEPEGEPVRKTFLYADPNFPENLYEELKA